MAVTAVAADEPALKPGDPVVAVWPVMFASVPGERFLPSVRHLKDYKELDAYLSGRKESVPLDGDMRLPSGAKIELIPEGMRGNVRRVLKPGETRHNDTDCILVDLRDGRAVWTKSRCFELVKPPAKPKRRRRR